MRATRSDRAEDDAICRELEGKFEALALELGRAIEALPHEEMGGDIWARLQCAKSTAEEGAAAVRKARSSGSAA
jgi:hypothetical protein